MKPLHRKLALAAIGSLILAATMIGGGAYLFSLLFADLCSDTVISTVDSPDHSYTATIYERDCGATTDFVTNVNLQPKYTGPFNPEKGTQILTQEGRHEVKATWLANDSLELNYPFDEVFAQEATWQDVKIKHTEARQ